MAVGDKIELASKSEVQAVEQNVATINTQLNAPTTGLDARVQAVEGFDTRITVVENTTTTLDDQVNNPVTGITEQLITIDSEINEVGTGLKARLTDLEAGGLVTNKFRTHSQNGVYEDGEVVQKDSKLYKANSVIDGSTTPVVFSVGVAGQQWTEMSPVDAGLSPTAPDSAATIADTDKFVHNDGGIIVQTGFNKLWTWITTKAAGAASTILSSNLTANRVLISNGSGKVAVGAAMVASRVMVTNSSGTPYHCNVNTTEMNYLQGAVDNVQIQLNNKKAAGNYVMKIGNAGTVNTTGVKLAGGIGTYNVSRTGVGFYAFSGLSYIDATYSMVEIEILTDPDNVYTIYEKNTNGFKVKFYDMPTMVAQDTAFRFKWLVAY